MREMVWPYIWARMNYSSQMDSEPSFSFLCLSLNFQGFCDIIVLDAIESVVELSAGYERGLPT